jgi:glyoxylase-like metal-dependent hydrolase (beta-lactamase superfamily II)
MIKQRWALAGALLATVLIAGFFAAPAIMAEVFIYALHHDIAVLPDAADPAAFAPRPGPALGKVVAGYWRVQVIAPDTYAIGEPQHNPDNYEYLLVGKTRALLIDAGATGRDIHAVLATLTRLPVTAIPTHLHWDHTNGLQHFTSIALIDLPQLRARQSGDMVQLTRHDFINNDPPRLRVSEWVRPDAFIDLGGRHVQVLSTPGHTATSVSIYDPPNRLLFTGDYLYPTTLYAFMPDSSLSAYIATADRLLAMLPPETRLFGAHCCRNDGPPQAPWLDLRDLRDVRHAIEAIRAGTASGSRGAFIRRYPVNPRMTVVTLYPFANR